jgi:hypothetical protein
MKKFVISTIQKDSIEQSTAGLVITLSLTVMSLVALAIAQSVTEIEGVTITTSSNTSPD